MITSLEIKRILDILKLHKLQGAISFLGNEFPTFLPNSYLKLRIVGETPGDVSVLELRYTQFSNTSQPSYTISYYATQDKELMEALANEISAEESISVTICKISVQELFLLA